MKLLVKRVSVGALLGGACFNALAASDADVDRLTTYASLLGRAVGVASTRPLKRHRLAIG